MIHYDCPKCGAAMASRESMQGQAETCSECGNITLVPAVSQTGSASGVGHQPAGAEARTSRSSMDSESGRDDRIVLSVRPVMFKSNPVIFILLIILFPLGLFLLPLWWLNCIGTLLTVTETRTILRKGIWSKATNEVRHRDVLNIRVRQNILQRAFDVGDIGISTAGQADIELIATGVPDPQNIAEAIRHRQA